MPPASENTVRDHLKAIFAKTAARSRRTLRPGTRELTELMGASHRRRLHNPCSRYSSGACAERRPSPARHRRSPLLQCANCGRLCTGSMSSGGRTRPRARVSRDLLVAGCPTRWRRCIRSRSCVVLRMECRYGAKEMRPSALRTSALTRSPFLRLVPPGSGHLDRDETASRIPGWGQPPTDESRRSRGST
jgi:hypothetical protein